MKRIAERGRPTLDLMEEAVHLLRSTSLQDFSWYLVGVLPFLLALLYFWMDMSWNAIAFQHRSEASLGLALSFLWMKCAQSIFAGRLHARVNGQTSDRITARRIFRIALFQTIIQPSKLFFLPAAALAAIPFGWTTAFYENVTVLGDNTTARKLMSRSWRLAKCWPRQNHCALAIYLLLLLLVFFNISLVVLVLPQLFQMFTGVETIFTRGGASLFNSTFFAIIGALTYLFCNPLLKATYALRCFYGEAQHSGADLAAEIRALPRIGALAAMLAVTLLLPASRAVAAPAPALSGPAVELNRAIDDTVARPEFSWKLPRQSEATKPASKWPFVDAIGRFLKATGRAISRTIRSIARWFDRFFASPNVSPAPSVPAGWQTSSRGLMTALIVVLVLVAIGLIVHTLREIRSRRSSAPAAPKVEREIDLESENVTADLLPEDKWLELARSHMDAGEVRLALRAFFLAALAHLAAREVLLLARHKSNRDYQRELNRKARDQPPLVDAFTQNISLLERVWYGRHEIDREGVRQFEQNLEEIRSC